LPDGHRRPFVPGWYPCPFQLQRVLKRNELILPLLHGCLLLLEHFLLFLNHLGQHGGDLLDVLSSRLEAFTQVAPSL